MDEIEICCISSEESADEEPTTSKSTKNITPTQTTFKRNIYDLNELEDDDICTENTGTNTGSCDDYLKELIQKYSQQSPSSSTSNTKRNNVCSYDESFNFPTCSSSTEERLNEDVEYYNSSQTTESSPKSPAKTYELLSSSDDENDNSIERKKIKQSNGYRTKSPLRENRSIEKISKKEQLEIERTNKRNEKIRKKEQLLEEKALKQAQKIVDNSCKQANNLKYITINMDNSICDDSRYGGYLRDYFDENKITYKIKTTLPGLISWTRKILSLENEKVKETETPEQHYAVIIKPTAFGNLLSCIQSIQKQVNFKHLSIIIYGQTKPNPTQEDEMTTITLQFPTYWQFVTTNENLGNFLFMLTKSIAQKPHEMNQELQYDYYEDCNRKKIKVDKDGSGMGQLWRQMLTMFPLVRLETAEAITAAYPTPSSLFRAFENCTESPEELIQDLPIRRAHGPSVANKKVGIKLSTKCFRYFTLKDDDLV
ncbi:unnamed protein product [Phyllotreta striolata]|uniref:Crossover junction endonuclease EME1 n=1 Tax=Phyllotreta striolata TaxID=444603 RepID=A0A9N9TZJ8_PHYSR|nr:unnamed protein product [Phyllotreta striolata]